MVLSLARHNPIVVQFFTIATALSSSLFPFWKIFFGLLIGCSSTLCAGTDICHQLHIPIQSCKIDIREDANTHKVICASTCQKVSAQSKNSASLTSASDASFSRRTSTSCHRWLRKCGGFGCRFFVHDRHSHAGNCTAPFEHTGLFLSTGSMYLFLFQRHVTPFDY